MKYIIRFLFIVLSTSGLVGQEQTPDFILANEAFQSGNYEQAIKLYEISLQAKQSAQQHFNLGSAYYFNSDLGQARLHFLKAKTLDPTDADILANLALTEDALQLPAQAGSIFADIAYLASPNTWSWLFALSFWCAIALLILPKVFKVHPLTFTTGLSLSVLIFLPSLIALSYFHFQKDKGVVLSPDTPMHVAPASTSPVVGYMPEGTIAKAIQSHEEYTLVSNEKNHQGWVANESFRKIFE